MCESLFLPQAEGLEAMSLAEELLTPIEPEAPAGQNLRYDAVYDQIAEARSEEDATLPVGQWARQSKKADYQLVSSLTRDALAKRSKDIWLAAWLGEARIQLDGLTALSAVFDLLVQLQEHFWDSLYPEIEDGDSGMRTAPLQWAMERYAILVYGLPTAAESVNYRDYKAVRTPSSGVTPAQPAVEALDAALKGTSKAFYVSVESQLTEARDSLERLYQFCDKTYRDDGPSFVKIRTAIDEVYNLVASLLRAKRELDPDPLERAPVASEPITPEPVAPVAEKQPEPQQVAEATLVPEQAPQLDSPSIVLTQQPVQQRTEAFPKTEPQSWEQGLEQIRQSAVYLSKERPDSPVPYLLLGAMHGGNGKMNGALQQPPSTELRMILKKASREGNGQLLLEESLRALALPCGAWWLDLHRYVWAASREAGHQAIADSVLDVVRLMLRQDSSLAESVFDDDTPKASQETKQWIEAEVLLADEIASTPQKIAAPEMSALMPLPTSRAEPMLVPEKDIYEEAESLAVHGNLMSSIQLLMQDAAASTRRISFQRRQQVARLCLARGQRTVACRLLEQLLAEADEHRLELWEGPHLVGEVIAMLLQSLDQQSELKTALMARLCQIDPVRALSLEVQAEEMNGTR
jgi:type VI secretion system protein ImpA